jgi:hypothetical protein
MLYQSMQSAAALLSLQVIITEMIISGELPRPQSMTAGPGSNPIKRFITFLRLKVRKDSLLS